MKLFDTANIKCNSSLNTVIYIDKCADINHIYSVLHYCYHNKKICVISDIKTFKINQTNTDNIYVFYRNKKHTISWQLLSIINSFFYDKLILDKHFKMSPCIFNIFFILLIDKYYSLKKNSDTTKLLIGNNNTLLGIYSSYNNVVVNSDISLYFSFATFSFILYNVVVTKSYVAGKLCSYITYSDGFLTINKNKIKCPNSFYQISNTKFAIKKKHIDYKITYQTKRKSNFEYNSIYHKSSLFNIFLTKLNFLVDENRLFMIHSLLINKYPELNYNSVYKYDAEKICDENIFFGLFYITTTNILIIQLPTNLSYYINNILSAINHYLSIIEIENKIEIKQHIIQSEKDRYIHIVSEIYYICYAVIYFIPKVIYNLHRNNYCNTFQINYVFNSNEISNLHKNKNDIFTDLSIYLKVIFIKALSVTMFNRFCYIQDENILNIIPIVKNCCNNNVIELLSRSEKSQLSNKFINSFIQSYIENSDIDYELPIVFLNIIKIDKSQWNNVIKVYSNSFSNNVPLGINVTYNDTSLNVNISGKKIYRSFPRIFEEIINELIE